MLLFFLLLCTLSITALFYYQFCINEIILSLCTGTIITTFFWIITIYIPIRRKDKLIIKKYYIFYYKFKERVIQILLAACNEYKNTAKVEYLSNYKNFVEYFGEEGKKKFYMALNKIQDNKEYFEKIIIELNLLLKESIYVINNISLINEDLYNFISSLNENLYRLENDNDYKYDQVKYLGTILWGYLANYSTITGYYQYDKFMNMVSKLY